MPRAPGRNGDARRLDMPTLENWLWDAACVIRGAVDAPKFKDYILPLVFIKRLSDVYEDELRRLAETLGDVETAAKMAANDHGLVPTAPGVLLFLNAAKPAKRRGRILLINASGEFAKGKPKNYVTEAGIRRIADTFLKWREVEKFSRVITTDEAKTNDYNLSPSRYVDRGEQAEHRPIAEIVTDLEAAEAHAADLGRSVTHFLVGLGVSR